MPPYEMALRRILDAQCATVEEIEDRCVACNLMYDGRIGAARENELYGFSDSDSPEVNRHPSTGRDLRRSLDRFFEKRIRTSKAPDYVRASLNRHNFVSVATGLNPSGLNPTVGLVSVLDLAGLDKVYLFAEERKLPGFEDYEAERRRDGMAAYLEKRMNGAPEKAADFVRLALDAIYERGKVIPYGPVWTVWWNDFKDYLDESAERWLDLLGMLNRHRDDKPHWLIALRYSLSSAGQVVRPTQFEAGWFPLHFPSPHLKPPSAGGHPMDLSMPPKTAVPLAEFVHKQVRHENSPWTGHQKVSKAKASGDLIRQRQRHFARLLHYNNGLAYDGWIGACVHK